MAAPQKNVRIPPSGPLAEPSNTIPLEEMAGLVFRDLGAGRTSAYRGAIGPVASPAADLGLVYYRGDGPTLAGSAFNQLSLPSQGDASPFALGAGFWRVTALLTMSYVTSLPVGSAGSDLNATFAILDDGGAAAVSAVYPGSPISRDMTIGTQADHATPGAAKSYTAEMVLEVTQAMVAANSGNRLPGLSVALTRSSNDVQPYDTNSGWLEFTYDCSLSVARYR